MQHLDTNLSREHFQYSLKSGAQQLYHSFVQYLDDTATGSLSTHTQAMTHSSGVTRQMYTLTTFAINYVTLTPSLDKQT